MTRLALMHEKAISYAKSQGFFHRQLVLAGWGFDKTSDYSSFEKKKPISNCLEGLSFGVLRKDKIIEINKNTRDRIEKFSVSNGIKKT